MDVKLPKCSFFFVLFFVLRFVDEISFVARNSASTCGRIDSRIGDERHARGGGFALEALTRPPITTEKLSENTRRGAILSRMYDDV